MNNFNLKIISVALYLSSIVQHSIKLRNNDDSEINKAITLVLNSSVLNENEDVVKSKINLILTQLKSATFNSELVNREYIESNRRLSNDHSSQLYPNVFIPNSPIGKMHEAVTSQLQLKNTDKMYFDLIKTSVDENRKVINAIIIELVSYLSSVIVAEKA